MTECYLLGVVSLAAGTILGFLIKTFLFKTKPPEHPEQTAVKSQELIDFFKDIDLKGYSLIRVDPDSVFHVGRKR